MLPPDLYFEEIFIIVKKASDETCDKKGTDRTAGSLLTVLTMNQALQNTCQPTNSNQDNSKEAILEHFKETRHFTAGVVFVWHGRARYGRAHRSAAEIRQVFGKQGEGGIKEEKDNGEFYPKFLESRALEVLKRCEG